MKFSKPDRSKARPANPEHFEGTVHMHHLVTREESQELEVLAVFFDNGARTRPHVHSTDQVLAVVEGTCVVADQTERRELQPGEHAHTPAGHWHWHGAAPGHDACHISIRKPGPTDWDVPEHDWNS